MCPGIPSSQGIRATYPCRLASCNSLTPPRRLPSGGSHLFKPPPPHPSSTGIWEPAGMPSSTSVVMAPILARQFAKLQAPLSNPYPPPGSHPHCSGSRLCRPLDGLNGTKRYSTTHPLHSSSIYSRLGFGLASAPAIFSTLGEALEWILHRRGVRAVIHNIDDFLLLGSPTTSKCTQALAITLQTCQELGIPMAQEKTEGPTIRLTFLGIQPDSSVMCTSLHADRMQTCLGWSSHSSMQR